jgi:UDP:flavonoid glycosyltransferase YjiC (YdhE family)
LQHRGPKTVRRFGDELERSRLLLRRLAADVVITDLMPVMNVAATLECTPSVSMLNLELVPAPLAWWNAGLRFALSELGVPDWAIRRLYGDALIVCDGADVLGLRELDPAHAAEISSSVREIRFVGPVQGGPRKWWSPAKRARHRVVISLGGGKSAILELILQQCEPVDADLVVVTGGPLEPTARALVERLRESRTVEVFDFLPGFADVLCDADALICHAGHGTLVQALSLGVPTLAVPLSIEQEINTKRLRGVGAVVIPALTGSAPLGGALDRLLRDRAGDLERRRVADQLASYGGVADAAQLVDRIASTRLPETGPLRDV